MGSFSDGEAIKYELRQLGLRDESMGLKAKTLHHLDKRKVNCYLPYFAHIGLPGPNHSRERTPLAAGEVELGKGRGPFPTAIWQRDPCAYRKRCRHPVMCEGVTLEPRPVGFWWVLRGRERIRTNGGGGNVPAPVLEICILA